MSVESNLFCQNIEQPGREQTGYQMHILDFAYRSRLRVLHVAVSNPQTFEFEFHLRSLPCAFGRQLALELVALLFAAKSCWRDPTSWKLLSTVAILGFKFGVD